MCAATKGRPRARGGAVVVGRREEGAAACGVLGVDKQIFLGYADSGMAGTDDNDAPGSFHTVDIDEAADRLIAVIEAERPDVIVTYDEKGFYGHPDHIRAHDVTLAAWKRTAGEPWAPRKLYLTSVPQSRMAEFR